MLANSRLRRHDRDLYSTIINQVSLWRCILSRGKSIGKEKGGGRRGRGEEGRGQRGGGRGGRRGGGYRTIKCAKGQHSHWLDLSCCTVKDYLQR